MAAVAEHAMTPVDGAFVEGKENEEKVGLAVPDQVDAEAPPPVTLAMKKEKLQLLVLYQKILLRLS